jgi:hypothetical protein
MPSLLLLAFLLFLPAVVCDPAIAGIPAVFVFSVAVNPACQFSCLCWLPFFVAFYAGILACLLLLARMRQFYLKPFFWREPKLFRSG